MSKPPDPSWKWELVVSAVSPDKTKYETADMRPVRDIVTRGKESLDKFPDQPAADEPDSAQAKEDRIKYNKEDTPDARLGKANHVTAHDSRNCP